MPQKIFKRNEIKFMITKEQYETIKTELLKYMNYDKYCQDGKSYMIYNFYFDNNTDDIIRRSIEKPYFKEKLRMRSYVPLVKDDDLVFLELKRKIGGVVSKRRATLNFKEAKTFLESGSIDNTLHYTDKQVLAEINEFITREKAYKKVYLSYERIAFYGKDDKDFRITFDKNITTRRNNLDMKYENSGDKLLDENKYLMEIKIIGSLPLWLVALLSKEKIYKTSFSKYGTEYKKYIKKKQIQRDTNAIKSIFLNQTPVTFIAT